MSEAKKVTDYSPRNQILILTANPDASELAGYKQWRSMGRQVRKGEKGIPIGAPVTRKQDDGTTKMVNVRGARVFDVSQTDALKASEPETASPCDDGECICDPHTGIYEHTVRVPEEDTPEGEAYAEPVVQVHESKATDEERTKNVRKAVRSYESTLEGNERDPFAAMRASLRD